MMVFNDDGIDDVVDAMDDCVFPCKLLHVFLCTILFDNLHPDYYYLCC